VSRLALVIQRYGDTVTGGSESLARAVAERLVPRDTVTVLTTCARDYVTWRNELPAGRETVAGVEVLRFAVEEERDLAAFNRFSDTLYAGAPTREAEEEWLRRQGPYCPALVRHLEEHAADFDAILFFTYLYYPTVRGVQVRPHRSVLVPTTHDEPPLRFSIYRDVFAAAGGFVFLTPPEAALVHARFAVGDRPMTVAGIGVDAPQAPPDAEAFARRHGLTRPYVLCAGRIDAGKGCAEMVDHHAHYRAAHPDGPDLVLIGTLAMPLPDAPWVRYLGRVSEEDKAAAMAGALAIVCPSPFESLSIVLLEGFAVGTPGLVNARSPVLLDHCLRSNGALWYEDALEYGGALDVLGRDARVRAALARSGRDYVAREYAWDTILARWRGVIDAVAR
jgi:glycosyltransferase involved in cell wall biosynthesis